MRNALISARRLHLLLIASSAALLLLAWVPRRAARFERARDELKWINAFQRRAFNTARIELALRKYRDPTVTRGGYPTRRMR